MTGTCIWCKKIRSDLLFAICGNCRLVLQSQQKEAKDEVIPVKYNPNYGKCSECEDIPPLKEEIKELKDQIELLEKSIF
jgi:hypothetical protein